MHFMHLHRELRHSKKVLLQSRRVPRIGRQSHDRNGSPDVMMGARWIIPMDLSGENDNTSDVKVI